jgi:antitoxin component of RelBE/YafQ-DinJ toxin-antitoxin module
VGARKKQSKSYHTKPLLRCRVEQSTIDQLDNLASLYGMTRSATVESLVLQVALEESVAMAKKNNSGS